MVDADSKVALVTGASRGIGAETAKQLAARGLHVVVNYREKAKRAQGVVEEIVTAGGQATALGADLADPAEVTGMLEEIRARFGGLHALILNASGGLERDADPGYALRLNRDAQVHLATSALPLMGPGGRVVFVTSHQAHFHGTGRLLPEGYEPIAAGKRAGEDALRALLPEFTRRGVGFVVVSGDMIDGTIIVRLLERRDPAAVEARRSAGPLPTVDDFARTVVAAVDAPVADGHTFYVGGEDYRAGEARPAVS
ncbi:SDR family oxidoreductase [Nocardia farcinica]|uniref:SDR family oxidoreductase n=1 Tax=Nocardia farcinica TaxID=37329 RepID=UPI001894BB6F|nr:SDR family oxidoreductase [Nocardia farcinica]MBF6421167.1 SDR family oxidoreductase [Nocardia farcinica]MBF6432824.1 SDR family oxidoreductase [Nocardia farcinica]MBF6503262.1 SDR family oxidoreductase [Nocardia farcinica]